MLHMHASMHMQMQSLALLQVVCCCQWRIVLLYTCSSDYGSTLTHISAQIENTPEHSTEDKTTSMMTNFIPSVIKDVLKVGSFTSCRLICSVHAVSSRLSMAQHVLLPGCSHVSMGSCVVVQESMRTQDAATYLDFDYSGNSTERASGNPSGVLKKLARPDLLVFADGATCMVGEDEVGLMCSNVSRHE